MHYFFIFLTFISTLITGGLFYPHKVQVTTPSSSISSYSSTSEPQTVLSSSSSSVSTQSSQSQVQSNYRPQPVSTQNYSTLPIVTSSSSSSQSQSSKPPQDIGLSENLKKAISELPADYVPAPVYKLSPNIPVASSSSSSSSQSYEEPFARGKYEDFIGAYGN